MTHAAQREPSDVGRRVEVRDQRLERVRRVELGRGDVLEQHLEERLQAVDRGDVGQLEVGVERIERGAPAARVAVHDREADLVLVGVEVEEELLHLVDDFGDAGVAAVDLVHHEDHGKAGLEGLAEHEAGLRQRSLARVDEEEDAVDHGERTLHLTAEVGVPGRVDDVDLHVAVPDGGVLGQDRDALLALQVHRVHDAVGHFLVGPERAGLAQHGVDEGGLAVVDVRDDRDVSQVVCLGFGARGHSGPFGGEPPLYRPHTAGRARLRGSLSSLSSLSSWSSSSRSWASCPTPPTSGCVPKSRARSAAIVAADHGTDVPGEHDDDQRAHELVLEAQVGVVVGQHHEHEERDGSDQGREGAGARSPGDPATVTTAPSASPAPPPTAQSTGSATALRPGPLTVDSSEAARTVRSRVADDGDRARPTTLPASLRSARGAE